MRKKYYVLIGVSILLQILGITMPFIGFGDDGICITQLPLSIFVSLLLLMLGLKGLYKDVKKDVFYNGFVLSVVGICVLIIATIISPVFAGGTLLTPTKYMSLIIENSTHENLLFIYTSQFLKSMFALLIVVMFGMLFYAIAINKFATGLRTLNIDNDHKSQLKKAIRKFSICNIINIALASLVILMIVSMFKIFYKYVGVDSMLYDDSIKLVLILLSLYLVLLPATIVTSIFYYINFIKSIILVFKTPKKFIIEEEKIDNVFGQGE